jgi:hypothetical protein
MPTQEQIPNPFVGPKSYEEKDCNIFFGRSKEIDELYQLVELNTLTLLYGKSGLGKSSLLQAGLFPLLRENKYVPIYIRPDYKDERIDYVDFIKNVIVTSSVRKDNPLSKHIVDHYDTGKTIWENLHAQPFIKCDEKGEKIIERKVKYLTTADSNEPVEVVTNEEIPLIPVFIFDQFEEIFTLGSLEKSSMPRENILNLIQLISEIVENYPPISIDKDKRADLHYEYSKKVMPVKVIFSFREEYLSRIFSAFKEKIPSLLYRNLQYELDFLNYDAGFKIISKAAGSSFTQAATEKILQLITSSDTLDQAKTREIESFILSVFCESEFNKIVPGVKEQIDASDIVIENLDALLETKYIAILKEWSEEEAKFLEDKLITESGNRILYPFQLGLNKAIRKEFIQKLENEKIIRSTSHNNKPCIEIVHDRYAEIIKKHKCDRQIAQEKKLQEKARKAYLRQAIQISTITGIVVVCIALLLGYRIYNKIETHATKVLVENFKMKNSDWLAFTSATEKDKIITEIATHWRDNDTTLETLSLSLRLAFNAKNLDNLFLKAYLQFDSTFKSKTKVSGVIEKSTTGISDESASPNSLLYLGLSDFDIFHNRSLAKINTAKSLMDAHANADLYQIIKAIEDSIKSRQPLLSSKFLMPDTLIGLESVPFIYEPSSDHNFFGYGYTNTRDYRKISRSYVNISMSDFSIQKEFITSLTDKGSAYAIIASSGARHNYVVASYDYSLRRNKVEYAEIKYTSPELIKLADANGKQFKDISRYSSASCSISPDGNFIESVKKPSEEIKVYNILNDQLITLTNSKGTEILPSFSSDSRKIAYYNVQRDMIYIASMDGKISDQIKSSSMGEGNVSSLNFTGDNTFLKVLKKDSITIFNIKSNQTVYKFSNKLVSNVIVSPDNKHILITYNATRGKKNEYDNYETDFLTVLYDLKLNSFVKLYVDCPNFFFTPDGNLIGYNVKKIMRFNIHNVLPPEIKSQHYKSFFNQDELIQVKAISYLDFAHSEDADFIQKGASLLLNEASETSDSVFYYKKSQSLFQKLISNKAKNIRPERVPFYYECINWIDDRLGNRDFNEQIKKQKIAVDLFDKMLQSKDSIYPQQLDNAAYGYFLLVNLYDSLHDNSKYVEQIKKEIALRKRVAVKNPDNDDNIMRLDRAYTNLNLKYLDKQKFELMQLLDADKKTFLSTLYKSNPGSKQIKKSYIESLANLAEDYIHLSVNMPVKYKLAIDSANHYIKLGYNLLAPKEDSLSLMLTQAETFLLHKDGLEKALKIYSSLQSKKASYSYIKGKTEKYHILWQLQKLKEASVNYVNPNIQKAIDFLNNNPEQLRLNASASVDG